MSGRAALLALALGLSGCSETPDLECPELDAGASADVSGTFFYSSPVFLLRGTITFEQEGETVRITDTTYENVNDRRLMGEGTIVGNRLDVVLVPINGDTDYSANVSFAFSEAGDSFCLVSFSDTNDDVGGAGSYRGERQN